MLPGRLCFGSLEMSAYQSLCLEIPHYHEQNGSEAKKTKQKCFQDTLQLLTESECCVKVLQPHIKPLLYYIILWKA